MQMVRDVSTLDIRELFADKFQRTDGTRCVRLPVPNCNTIPEEGAAGVCGLAKVIRAGSRHDHFRLESDLLGIRISNVVKQTANIARSAAIISHGKCRFDERFLRKCTQESDRIEEI